MRHNLYKWLCFYVIFVTSTSYAFFFVFGLIKLAGLGSSKVTGTFYRI